jgi:endoglucanase
MRNTQIFVLVLIALVSNRCSTSEQPNVKDGPTTDVNWLTVKGDKMVNQKGDTVVLKGFGLGGLLHLENFINGFPANEQQFREGLLSVLGPEKYNLFFEEFYSSYFTEADAKYINSTGLNLIRIPIHYRVLEDDMNPRVIKEEGFKHLDRVVELCAKYNIYTIIDLHALPGYQNQDWHSDNPTHKAFFWEHKDFQDRVEVIWKAIANRYKDQPWVAGYDLINEPADPTNKVVVPYFKRLYDAIKEIDDRHIIFIEGNKYASEFHMFDEIWENVVYTNHDYAGPGFINGGPYPGYTHGMYYDKDVVDSVFMKRSEFMFENNVPVWVGEFGPVYTGDSIKDEMRYQLLKDQLSIYEKHDVSWCLWLYKDLGLQAITHQKENTPWMELIADFREKKARLGADAWGSTDEQIQHAIRPIYNLFQEEFPEYAPYPFGAQAKVSRLIRNVAISEALIPEFVALFKDKTDEELIALAQSFHFDNCNIMVRLEKILTREERY